MKKRGASRPKIRKRDAGLREDVLKAIKRVWPDNLVEMTFDSEESYFWDIHPRLTRALERIKGADLLLEREAKGEPIWHEGVDRDEDPPADFTTSRSYHLFFVSPKGEAFMFETETEEMDEEAMAEGIGEPGWKDPPMKKIPGEGRTGWSVAVSLPAPFAVVSLGDMLTFEDGSTWEPGIESCAQTEDGEPITDSEAHFRKFHGEPAFEILQKLRSEIVDILERHGLTVLQEDEWRKPVPWLRGGEEVFAGASGEPIRVLDAFFFEGL
ncbi:MAG: hypothetical protein DMG09_24895 [Acidobacteria bacterium]|nr:MAG: hypothetical protein DMG09_24895 [Acidobacteriota bacterium]